MPKEKSCIDCESHVVLPDPDPHDWFCDDDVKVMCQIEKRIITCACRPYKTREECTPVPKWCPKNYNTKDTKKGAKKD